MRRRRRRRGSPAAATPGPARRRGTGSPERASSQAMGRPMTRQAATTTTISARLVATVSQVRGRRSTSSTFSRPGAQHADDEVEQRDECQQRRDRRGAQERTRRPVGRRRGHKRPTSVSISRVPGRSARSARATSGPARVSSAGRPVGDRDPADERVLEGVLREPGLGLRGEQPGDELRGVRVQRGRLGDADAGDVDQGARVAVGSEARSGRAWRPRPPRRPSRTSSSGSPGRASPGRRRRRRRSGCSSRRSGPRSRPAPRARPWSPRHPPSGASR